MRAQTHAHQVLGSIHSGLFSDLDPLAQKISLFATKRVHIICEDDDSTEDHADSFAALLVHCLIYESFSY